MSLYKTGKGIAKAVAQKSIEEARDLISSEKIRLDMQGIKTIPCPRCWTYLKGLSVRKRISHIVAIGKIGKQSKD